MVFPFPSSGTEKTIITMALDTVYCILDTKQKPVHTSTFPRMEKKQM